MKIGVVLSTNCMKVMINRSVIEIGNIPKVCLINVGLSCDKTDHVGIVSTVQRILDRAFDTIFEDVFVLLMEENFKGVSCEWVIKGLRRVPMMKTFPVIIMSNPKAPPAELSALMETDKKIRIITRPNEREKFKLQLGRSIAEIAG